MKLYVSTSAILNPFDLQDVLEKYSQLGITNIELGSSHNYVENIEDVLNRFNNNYVVHNYFPPLKNPLALNIASLNKDIKNASVDLAKRAIDLCEKYNAPIYSMHGGMLADPNEIKFFEGFTFTNETNVEEIYTIAFNNLVDSCKEINFYAKQRGVKFAIETSGGHPDKFHYLMMTKREEFRQLIKEVNDENFGILLDIGHYNISVSIYEDECMNKFIEEFKDKIFQIHIHHNDGTDDQHFPPTDEELRYLNYLNKDTIIVLESMKNTGILILEQYKNIENYLLKG